jgi:hypothetical protein
MEFLVRWAIRSYRTKAASEMKPRGNDYQLGGRIGPQSFGGRSHRQTSVGRTWMGGGGAKGVMLRILLGQEGVSVRPFRHWQLADALLDRRAFRAALCELVAHLAPDLARLLRLAGLLRGDAEKP